MKDTLENYKEKYFYSGSYYEQNFNHISIPYHFHPNFEIISVKKGKCIIEIKHKDKEEQVILNTRELIFLYPNVKHKIIVRNNCNIINLELNYEDKPSRKDSIYLANLFGTSTKFNNFASLSTHYLKIIDTNSIIKTLENILSECDNTNNNDDNLLLKYNYLQNLFIYMGRCLDSNENLSTILHVKKALEYIQKNFSNKIIIKDIADYVGINENYLQRMFKTYTQHKMIDYINIQRINRSKILLKDTNLPIIEIAIEVGYNTRQHFSYMFKRYELTTPLTYRDLIRKNSYHPKNSEDS